MAPDYTTWYTTSTTDWGQDEATSYIFAGKAPSAEPSTPHPRFRQYIESAARKLGPERCKAGLQAFDGRPDGDWESCVLACAYGEHGALFREHELAEALEPDPGMTAARLLGLTYREVIAVINSFDGDWGDVPREVLRSFFTLEAAKMVPHQRTEPQLVLVES